MLLLIFLRFLALMGVMGVLPTHTILGFLGMIVFPSAFGVAW